MPRKKVVFVIVEGPSDETALGVLLSRHFDKDTVYTHVMHCDITTEYDKDKEMDAVNFALHYREDIPGFINFISKSDFAYKPKPELSLTDNHKESWKEIQAGCNSLKRHTNFGLAFM